MRSLQSDFLQRRRVSAPGPNPLLPSPRRAPPRIHHSPLDEHTHPPLLPLLANDELLVWSIPVFKHTVHTHPPPCPPPPTGRRPHLHLRVPCTPPVLLYEYDNATTRSAPPLGNSPWIQTQTSCPLSRSTALSSTALADLRPAEVKQKSKKSHCRPQKKLRQKKKEKEQKVESKKPRTLFSDNAILPKPSTGDAAVNFLWVEENDERPPNLRALRVQIGVGADDRGVPAPAGRYTHPCPMSASFASKQDTDTDTANRTDADTQLHRARKPSWRLKLQHRSYSREKEKEKIGARTT
ncbi:hypothetical protein B0H16DRAFT_1884161 [Mycena metata]|uniref:Uncharacterized protein n=1 Tax=Mycena metata TaxID=1033252 RepID=A0AAD7JDL7_9AGAR|nr:hypothetical protein B0H16DRAFT_1884161 [Mycena metata]